jgi:hypothetical protein
MGQMGQGGYGAYGAYEFNELENAILARTASRAKLWGVISTVLGVTQMIGSCGMISSSSLGLLLPTGIVATIVGIVFVGVGNSLSSVVGTRGQDVPHLMAAMQKMSTAFTVQIVCNVIGVVLVAIMMVFLFFAAIVAAVSR